MSTIPPAPSSAQTQDPRLISHNPLDLYAGESRLGNGPRPIFVPRIFVERFGRKTAIILAQISYWIGDWNASGRPRAQRARNPLHDEQGQLIGFWWGATNEELSTQTGISSHRTIRESLHTLQEAGIITTLQKGRVRMIGRGENWLDGRACQEDRSVGVSLHPWLTQICQRNIPSALLLAQVLYWHGLGRNGRCRLQIFRGPDQTPTLAKSWSDLGQEVGVNARNTADRAGKMLVDLGLVSTHPFYFRDLRVNHIVLQPRLKELIDECANEDIR